MVSVRKHGKVYEYRIKIASIDGVRKWLTKSGFKTRQEALHEGAIAYNEYYQCGKKQKQKDMSYSDYLDYWIENYCKVNLKYNTIQTYNWNKPLANHSNDILAMAYNDTNISPIADSKYARYGWHMTRYDNELGWYDGFDSTTFNSGNSKWRIGQGGYSVIIDLKNDEISSDSEHMDQVWNQSAYMYFNVQKSTDVTLYVLDVYGSYQHAKSNISLSSLANVILDTSAYNIINFVDEGISEEYDNMRKLMLNYLALFGNKKIIKNREIPFSLKLW